jgi:hypothetical protein
MGLLIIFSHPAAAQAQGAMAPLDPYYYHLLDRYEIGKGSFAPYHTSHRPYGRLAIARLADALYDSLQQQGSAADRFNIQFLANDNWEWSEKAKVERSPLLKYFYRTTPDLYSVQTPDFDLHLSPVLWLQAGSEGGDLPKLYRNTRGLELRANIEQKVSLYAYVGENQARFPQYVRQRISERGVVPGEAFWKRFKDQGVDYFTARGHVSFNPIKSINLQVGHERFQIGNGLRSMILSDYGPAFPYIKLQTQVWRFSYTNIFAQMRGEIPSSPTGTPGSTDYPKKFFAMHHLSLNITDNFNLGLFEAVVSGDENSRGIEADYFNPVIFYRAIEQYGGSNDNALVGMDAKWNLFKRVQLYGQFVLDEFLLSAYQQGNGWWGNKWASQLGGKYINVFGLPNLDVQVEWNRARPFMYTHQSNYTSYTHYGQPLAHPLGANFDEKLLRLIYQPLPRLQLQGTAITASYGTDGEGENWGGDIFEPYTTRTLNEGNKIGQGIANKLLFGEVQASYMLAHRLWLEGSYTLRRRQPEGQANHNTKLVEFGLRWNIARPNLYF